MTSSSSNVYNYIKLKDVDVRKFSLEKTKKGKFYVYQAKTIKVLTPLVLYEGRQDYAFASPKLS